MEEKNDEDELNKITEEEVKKMNIWQAEQRQKSIEKYGKDIFTDKTIGNKNLKKLKNINQKIDLMINIFHILLPIAVTVILIAGLIMAWGGLIRS
jgi:hypothetical protein